MYFVYKFGVEKKKQVHEILLINIKLNVSLKLTTATKLHTLF